MQSQSREWNSSVYHRLSGPQVSWGKKERLFQQGQRLVAAHAPRRLCGAPAHIPVWVGERFFEERKRLLAAHVPKLVGSLAAYACIMV